MGESPLVDNKSKKYDRQVRIWGTHGQAALEKGRICCLGATAVASEALKNLVLGGIAGFTLVDDGKVRPQDLGNNFLVEQANLGQPLAQVVTEFLKELNEAVEGSFLEESPVSLLARNPDFFKGFALVIATQMREADVLKLEEVCPAANVRLMIVRAYGLFGSLRVSAGEHTVIESKPDNTVEDLRLHHPWPELQGFADSIDLDTADEHTHRHTPYAVILIKAVAKWCAAHSGKLPSNSKEKAEFKEMLRSWLRRTEGVVLEEDSFTEAVEHARKVFSPPSIPSEVRQLLDDEAVSNLTAETPDFWILTAALKAYVDGEGAGILPVEGSIPDMISTTETYLRLQQLYREKAERDTNAVEAHARRLLQSVGRDPQAIPHADIRNFVKNARNLRVVRYKTLAEETSTPRRDMLRSALAAEDTAANASIYVLLRAVDRFYATNRRYPGTLDSVEEDTGLLKNIVGGLLAEIGASSSAVVDDLLGEVVRCGGGELHCIAAVMGGIASQEAIKLITRQFVPLGGTLIYNAIASTTSIFTL